MKYSQEGKVGNRSLEVFKSFSRRLRRILAASVLSVLASSAFAEKGINGNELFRLQSADLEIRVQKFKELGVKWVRFDFDWSVIQPTSSTYNIAGHDRVVESLHAAGIKVLGIIAYTPGWANGGQSTKFYPPTSNKNFAKFASYLAGRYKGKVSAWEIWNEPNLGQFWGPAADPSAYSALLRQAYPAIKRVAPEATVVTGGLAQPGNSATNMESLQFLQLMYGSGARNYFDAVGNHPYTSPRLPLDSGAYNWRKMYATTPSFRSVMDQYGDGAKKIWVTEYGGPTYGTDLYGTRMTEDQQAAMVTQSLQLAASYSWMGPMFWYNFKDFCGYDASRSTECYYGLLRSDSTPKPAYSAYQASPY